VCFLESFFYTADHEQKREREKQRGKNRLLQLHQRREIKEGEAHCGAGTWVIDGVAMYTIVREADAGKIPHGFAWRDLLFELLWFILGTSKFIFELR
jgi:hypothetical protein